MLNICLPHRMALAERHPYKKVYDSKRQFNRRDLKKKSKIKVVLVS